MQHELAAERRPLPVGSTDGREMGWWGMMCLIATEASLFGYLLFGYYYFAAQFGRAWLPDKLPEFHLSLPNTLILIASSATVWWAERAIGRGHRGQAVAGLVLSILLGAGFMVIQFIEWSNKTFSLATNSYGSFYFVTTGFHMAHVAVGLFLLIGVLVWTAMGWFDPRRHAPLSIATIYWHFVDAVWLAGFFTYYVSPPVV
jgi:cytochrome c oxidase subunit III